MYDLDKIIKSYIRYTNDPYLPFYCTFKDLANGESVKVFKKDVVARVKLEYMGAVNDSGQYNEYFANWDSNNKCVNLRSSSKPIENLIQGNAILKDSTRLYAETATSKRINTTGGNEILKFIENLDLNDELSDIMTVQSWAGKCLLKPAFENDELSISIFEPTQYFPIFSKVIRNRIEGYCIITQDKTEKDTVIYLEIHTNEGLEFRKYKLTGDAKKPLVEMENDDIFSNPEFGLKKTDDNLGYFDPSYKEISVFEVNNIFNRTDYDSDTISKVRDLVVGDTLTSQAFDKVANPLLQVPDSIIEYTKAGTYKVRLDDRIITARPDDKEVKQIALETKTNEWLENRKEIMQNIYNSLGVNEVAFGNLQTGASGEALRRGLERTMSTVEAKRKKALVALEKVLVAGYRLKTGNKQELSLKGDDLLTLGMDIKTDIVVKCVQNGIMSLETALKFMDLQDVEIEKEIEKIKSSVDYKTKLANILNIVGTVGDTAELQKLGANISQEIINELGLGING